MEPLFTMAEYRAAARAVHQAQLDRKGADQIQFADQSVHFETWDEVRKHLDWMLANTAGRTGTRYAATSKGA